MGKVYKPSKLVVVVGEKMSQTQNIKQKIRIDLSKLYELTDRVDESAATLLKKILNHYNISYKFIALASPDFPQTIIIQEDKEKSVYSDINSITKDCNAIELFDGYETAVACLLE